MKINNLKINGFGKLENKEINFSEGINLIYGNNEAGKTTLLKFISSMFYGVSKNKNKKEFSDFEKYKPWKAEEFSGKINYTLDNNEKYEIFREFNKKNPKVYKDGADISKNFNIDKTKGNEFFYEQTKVDEPIFFSTSLIEQKETVLNNNDQSILTQKIANIMSTGEENISFKKTISTLDKKLVEEVGTDRTVGRPLNLINEKIRKITEEKSKIEFNENKIKELDEKKVSVKNKIEEKEIKTDLVKKVSRILQDKNLNDEKIKINNNLIKEEKLKLEKIQNKLEENKIEKRNNNSIYFFISLILFIINIILFIFKINKIMNIILLFFTLLLIVFIIINKLKMDKKIKDKNKINNNYLSDINSIKNNIEKLQNNIDIINEEKNNKYNEEKNKIIEIFRNKIDENEIDYLLNENEVELDNILKNLENEIQNLKLQLYTNDIDYNNVIKKLEEKAKLEEELQANNEAKEEVLDLGETISITIKALENAYNKMKKEITPQFTKDLSNIVERISNGKYCQVKYIDGEGLIVELPGGEYINSNKLSIGTIDELYLSLRLSAMNEITEETMPIIMDETFAYFDNERLENILKYLNESAKNRQIIIFTCSNREKELLEKNGIKYNHIKLT